MPYAPRLQLAFAAVLLINLVILWFRGRSTGPMTAFWLAGAGALVIGLAKMQPSFENIAVWGVGLTLAGSLLGVLKLNRRVAVRVNTLAVDPGRSTASALLGLKSQPADAAFAKPHARSICRKLGTSSAGAGCPRRPSGCRRDPRSSEHVRRDRCASIRATRLPLISPKPLAAPRSRAFWMNDIDSSYLFGVLIRKQF